MIQLGLILIFCYLYVKITRVNEVKIDGERADVIRYFALYRACRYIKSTNTSAEYAEIMPGIFALLKRYGEPRVSPHKAEWRPEISREKWNHDRCIWEPIESPLDFKELSDAANVLTRPTIEDIDSQLREAILVGEPQSVIDNLLDKRNEIK